MNSGLFFYIFKSVARCKYLDMDTVEDLVSKSEDEMMKVRNLGRKSLEEVMAKLDSLGFKLNTDDDN